MTSNKQILEFWKDWELPFAVQRSIRTVDYVKFVEQVWNPVAENNSPLKEILINWLWAWNHMFLE